jgi:hypothetical protein
MEYTNKLRAESAALRAQEFARREMLKKATDASTHEPVSRSELAKLISDARKIGTAATARGVQRPDTIQGPQVFKKRILRQGYTATEGSLLRRGWILSAEVVASKPHGTILPYTEDVYNPDQRKAVETTHHVIATFLDARGNLLLAEAEANANPCDTAPNTFAELHKKGGSNNSLTSGGLILSHQHNNLTPNFLVATTAMSEVHLELLDVQAAYQGLEELAQQHYLF